MTILNLLLDSRAKKSSKTQAKMRRHKAFRFELLEPRQLLSCGGTAVDADTLALKQANAGGVRHGCVVEISDDTISNQR